MLYFFYFSLSFIQFPKRNVFNWEWSFVLHKKELFCSVFFLCAGNRKSYVFCSYITSFSFLTYLYFYFLAIPLFLGIYYCGEQRYKYKSASAECINLWLWRFYLLLLKILLFSAAFSCFASVFCDFLCLSFILFVFFFEKKKKEQEFSGWE